MLISIAITVVRFSSVVLKFLLCYTCVSHEAGSHEI